MKKNKDKSLFDLPKKERERIMRSAADKANKAQQDLDRRYERQFGKADATSGCQ